MDKVRAIARVIWIQRFWVLSVISTLVAVLCWNMAAGDLQAEFTKRKGEIDSIYNSVDGIKKLPVHPNDNVNQGDMEQAKQQRTYVLKVWQELYESQRSKVLFWPASLGEQFVSYMEKRKFRDDINPEMRGFYHNYIETQFDALLEIVKAKKTNTGSRSSGGEFGGEYGGGLGGEYGGVAGNADLEDEDYLVQWLDQGKLQQKLSFNTKPSSTQVWVTQEDLWVYETLLHVIADTNKSRGTTRSDNAAVQVIVNLQVGSAAAGGSTGNVYIPQPTESSGAGGEFGSEMGEMGEYGGEYGGGEMSGEMGGYGGEYGGGEMSGEMGGYGGEYGGRGMAGGGGGGGSLLANRYLDAEGNPDPGTGETVGSTEFRQLPIRMTLMMDQRVIPRILIECANAALPVEVKQLRVNPSQSGGNFGGRNPSRGLNVRGLVPGVNLAEVEIRGVVYIYNPPNTDELAIPGAEEGMPTDEVALQ